jgi:hypothetical protein
MHLVAHFTQLLQISSFLVFISRQSFAFGLTMKLLKKQVKAFAKIDMGSRE